jgi:hypothetical protein
VILFAAAASAGSLETPFTSVVVRDLPVGRRTRVAGADGKSYTIRNNSDQTVEVRLTATKPFQMEGKQRTHEDIPDPSWLAIAPASLTLKPGEEGAAELILGVPDDPQYANRRYEVWLLAQTENGQMALGLISRIKFNTVKRPPPPATSGSRGTDPVSKPANTNEAETASPPHR